MTFGKGYNCFLVFRVAADYFIFLRSCQVEVSEKLLYLCLVAEAFAAICGGDSPYCSFLFGLAFVNELGNLSRVSPIDLEMS